MNDLEPCRGLTTDAARAVTAANVPSEVRNSWTETEVINCAETVDHPIPMRRVRYVTCDRRLPVRNHAHPSISLFYYDGENVYHNCEPYNSTP
ncbi:hypothetical protein EVAR_52829_1 [Eumeta japonica]|uniref:Uncharacterized protein n=1 Tax=Eumeta variegata TaxID=151549 RepID=A0A4C1YD70_EUMVA|nr:hypothetical protein EVAR_52829_1 [Eumeta japonica]